jgi:tetratricopeptide (TPR) repeat protein
MPLFKGIVSRPNLDKPENLFLLTSREVYSATQHLTNTITNYTNATLIGEPTSSKPNFYGSPETFSLLNNSGFVFKSSTIFFKEVEPIDRNIATYPNYFVPYSSEDYKNNIDPVLEKVFSFNSNTQFASYYKEKLKKAYTDNKLDGVKNEYQKLKSEIVKQGINLNDILFTDFDMWMSANRISDEKYIEYLEFLDQEFPNDYLPKYWLAFWIDSEGNHEKAKEYYKKALEINPTHKAMKLEYELLLFDEERK